MKNPTLKRFTDYEDYGDCVCIKCPCGNELWPSFDDDPTHVCDCGRVYRIERTLRVTVEEAGTAHEN